MINTFCFLSPNYSFRPPVKYVLLGGIKTYNDSNAIQMTISETIGHPKFQRPSRYNDVALIKLSQPIQFNAYVRPACLSTDSNPMIEIGTESGYARYNHDKPECSGLRKLWSRLLTQEQCTKAYANAPPKQLSHGIDAGTQLCVVPVGITDKCSVIIDICYRKRISLIFM